MVDESPDSRGKRSWHDPSRRARLYRPLNPASDHWACTHTVATTATTSLNAHAAVLIRPAVALRCGDSHGALDRLSADLGTIAPEHQGKRGSRADQKAVRINKIDVPALSAKPRSPVQIRAPPPMLFAVVSSCAAASPSRLPRTSSRNEPGSDCSFIATENCVASKNQASRPHDCADSLESYRRAADRSRSTRWSDDDINPIEVGHDRATVKPGHRWRPSLARALTLCTLCTRMSPR